VAAEQDAARDRVLAARSEFDAEFQGLGASARDAVDIPAKVRRNPAKAAAVAGGVAFLALRGPQRLWRGFRTQVFGRRAPLPKRMLPKEIERALDKMGDDGEKVRGTLERDFADYVKQRQQSRRAIPTVLLLAAARPLIGAAARRAADYLTAPPSSGAGPSTRIGEFTAQVGARAREMRDEAAAKADDARSTAERAAGAAKDQVDKTADAAKNQVDKAADAAKDRVDQVRGADAPGEEPPTGV
jgi:hypothetical protein